MELLEEKAIILLETLVVKEILLVSIFFPSFKYSIIINLLIWHSHWNNYFLKNSFGYKLLSSIINTIQNHSLIFI